MLAAAAAPGAADEGPPVVRNAAHRYQLEVEPAWLPQEVADSAYSERQTGGTVARWRHAHADQHMVLSRMDGSGRAAWRNQRDFYDRVERGVRRSMPEYERVKRRLRRLGKVPAMDLWFRYQSANGEPRAVAMRFIFFRSYAVSLAVEMPAGELRTRRRTVKRLLATFLPYSDNANR